MNPSPLVLRLFGPFRILIDGEPIPRVRTRSVEWLLALLVLRHGSPISRTWLAGTLWPESEDSRALQNLRDDLVRLRKALGSEAGRIQPRGRDSLWLDLAGADVDLLRFDLAMKAGDEGSLKSAVEAYAGPLLEGCYEEWVVAERSVRAQQYVTAVESLADLASQRGQHSEAIRLSRLAEVLEPMRDSLACRLMVALSSSGDPAAAIEVYRRHRKRLREELDADPDEETTRLFREIRERAREAGARPQPAVPPRSPRPSFHEPPRALGRLIGREEDIAAIGSRLAQSRLVTLVGSGGVGKTRLAMELATQASSDLEAGTAWVDLAPLPDGSYLLPAIGEALGLGAEDSLHGETLAARLSSQLAGASMLLVLDNCEHLVDAAASAADALLQKATGLTILATSRQRLGLAAEVAWRVPSLSVPNIESLPKGQTEAVTVALESPAIQLFYQRATSANSAFQLARREDVEAVCRICERLDGIPLAIELAAARVRSLTVNDIHDRLDQRFRLLTGGSTILPRHYTLRSLIDWSYELLTGEERNLLCRLSTFANGWTLEAAERVCAGGAIRSEEVLDHLTSLADRSMVVAETGGTRVRYRLLETMRQYARDRMHESGEIEILRDRHLHYCVALAEEAEANLSAGLDQTAWLARLETEHDNLRAALDWSGERPEFGLRLSGALWRFWMTRGHLHEGRRNLERMLATGAGSAQERARALNGAGILAWAQADHASAWRLHRECLAIRRELGDRRDIASSLINLGLVALNQQNYKSARDHYEDGLAIFRDLGARSGMANALGNLGGVAYRQRDYAAARSYFEECLLIQREIGDQWGAAMSLSNLGFARYELQDWRAARKLHEESLAIRKELGDTWGIACSLEGVAAVDAVTGSTTRAAQLWGAAERLREEIGTPLPTDEQDPYQLRVTAARAEHGDDVGFDRARTEGRELSRERAMELALCGAGDSSRQRDA